mmetsp:Transcript_18438/g.37407  ORF Transcript_18438/g.37407 Transcript_18438/m.37407 type:complete len:91 (-) Transcript_18438:757-1029(-)
MCEGHTVEFYAKIPCWSEFGLSLVAVLLTYSASSERRSTSCQQQEHNDPNYNSRNNTTQLVILCSRLPLDLFGSFPEHLDVDVGLLGLLH